MNRSSLFYSSALVFALISLEAIARADFTTGMIARWTFNQGDERDLEDDVSKAKLEAGTVAAGMKPAHNADGTLSVPAEVFLRTPAIDHQKFPQLLKTATLWARLKIKPNETNTTFLMGLTNKDRPGDWTDQRLIALWRPKSEPPGLGVHANLEGTEIGMGPASVAVQPDTFVEIAIAFDSAVDSATLYVDGKPLVRKKSQGGVPLASFTHFMLGRLSAAAGAEMVLDEVRIYDTTIPADWIREIKAVAKP
jgi:hypothetical protein